MKEFVRMGKSRTNLAEKFPELAKKWHPSLNGTLTPYDVSPSGKMKNSRTQIYLRQLTIM